MVRIIVDRFDSVDRYLYMHTYTALYPYLCLCWGECELVGDIEEWNSWNLN